MPLDGVWHSKSFLIFDIFLHKWARLWRLWNFGVTKLGKDFVINKGCVLMDHLRGIFRRMSCRWGYLSAHEILSDNNNKLTGKNVTTEKRLSGIWFWDVFASLWSWTTGFSYHFGVVAERVSGRHFFWPAELNSIPFWLTFPRHDTATAAGDKSAMRSLTPMADLASDLKMQDAILS